MAHPNVDTSRIRDAIIDLKSSLSSVLLHEDGERFFWISIKDRWRVVKAELNAIKNLDAAVFPADQRKLETLLDEISEEYHFESGEPIVGPPDPFVIGSLGEMVWLFHTEELEEEPRECPPHLEKYLEPDKSDDQHSVDNKQESEELRGRPPHPANAEILAAFMAGENPTIKDIEKRSDVADNKTARSLFYKNRAKYKKLNKG
ncbi:MAG: hypothetical protein COA78_17090 [Blastopirellula sp.]|nr:MAG: hypothetical protein COA78_17090 [Blastopirellula sp.]